MHKRILSIIILILTSYTSGITQTLCESNPNIDFEFGSYLNWNFEIGTCCPIATAPFPQTPGRHTLTSGTGVDFWGGFPIVDPVTGNSFSLKLGNSSGNHEAEKAIYNVNVPVGSSSYQLIYRYAVVLNEPPGHTDLVPRFEVNARNLTTGLAIPCAQTTYVAGPSSGLTPSPLNGNVLYRGWTTASINLSGMGGNVVAVEFATGDCGYVVHFGYAYIDMQCGLFADTVRPCCPYAANLTAPGGFQTYTWYRLPDFASPIGTGANISVPCSVDKYAVIMQPFPGFGCSDTFYVNVIPKPSAVPGTITGPSTVCGGNSYVFGNSPGATPGGTWSSSNPALAPINPSSGAVTFGGVSAPTTAIITYTAVLPPCPSAYTTKVVTINPSPAFSIVAPFSACSGDPFPVSVTSISNCFSGCTYLWGFGATTPSAIHPPVSASVPIGHITSLTLTNSPYMCSTTVDAGVYIYPIPEAGVITCPGDICAANTLSYFCYVTGNNTTGTWSLTGGGGDVSISPTAGTLSINPIMTVPRAITVYYVVSDTCGVDTATCTFNVFPNPQYTVTGTTDTCSPNPFTLNVTFTSPYSSTPTSHTYLWNTGATTSSITDSVVTSIGLSIPYTVSVTNSFGCTTTMNAFVNIDPHPEAGVALCPGDICAAEMMSFDCEVTGNNGPGTWYITGGGADVTIDPTYGWLSINPATSVPRAITAYFVVSNICGSDTAICTFNVYPNPQYTVTGPSDVCSGDLYTRGVLFTSPYDSVSTTHTYLWSTGETTSSITHSTITTDGIAIPYTVSVTNSFGCTTTMNAFVNVNPNPEAFIEMCPSSLCVGETTTVWGFPGGGGPYTTSWTATPPSGGVVTLSSPTPSSIDVTGTTAGTATLSFHVTNPSPPYCSGYATCIVTVNPSPAPITGPTSVCVGGTATLSQSVPGGTWTSSNYSVANVTDVAGDGLVTGISAGTVTITYSISGCYTTYTMTVVPAPTPTITICLSDLCEGDTGIIGGDPAYASGYTVTWTATPASGTVVTLYGGVSTGVWVAGTSVGTAVVTYTVTDPSTGCSGYAYCTVNVHPAPMPIMGITDVCEGEITTLTCDPPGGIWSSSDPTVATVNPAGVVTGVTGGTATITYTLVGPTGIGCYSVITVNVIRRATACVSWAYDPGCGCNAFIFTGTPGADVHYDVLDCMGSPISSGTLTLNISGNGVVHSSSLPRKACELCINTIEYMGCTWPCSCPAASPGSCCALIGHPKPGRTSGTEHGLSHLEVIPNPTEGQLTLTGYILTNEDMTLEVLNLLGQSVYTASVRAEEGKVDYTVTLQESLANGTYLIRLKNEEVNETVRFILDR